MLRVYLRISLCLLISTPLCLSQSTTGLPPFSTIQGSLYDTVKINDGAVMLTLPVRNKAGLIPFSYSLVLNDGIGVLAGYPYIQTNWNPQTSVGFSPAFGAGFSTAKQVNCPDGKTKTLEYSNAQVTDGYGTVHPVRGMQYDSQHCLFQSLAGIANDDSGYTLVVDSNGLNATVSDRAGNTMKGTTFTDANQNKLSFTAVCVPASCSSNEVYTYTLTYEDTTGLTPMTETQTWTPVPPYSSLTQDQHSWTDAAGKTQSYTINYSPYLHVTNFGCYLPSDNTASTWYMPSSITTPEGTYVISYEKTLGYSGYYTGRIAKIVFPSGASVAYTYTGGMNNAGFQCEAQTATGVYYSTMVPVLTRTLTDTNGTQHQWK
jgi:hypothetical protein